MDKLIYDRTENDVKNKTNKGYYNISDLNRVEEWCRYLGDLLTYYNYRVDITTKTNWKLTDMLTVSEMERIRKNIALLKSTYLNVPQNLPVPNNLNPINISKANDIERILEGINNAIINMEKQFVYNGVANVGQNRIWQQRFRRFDYETYIYKLRNIIPDSSFENDLWIGANYSKVENYKGNRSLCFQVGTTYVPHIEIERPIIGHKYYGRRYIKSLGDNQPADCRFEMWGADGENCNWVFAWNRGNHLNWEFDSDIHEIKGVAYPETDRTIIRCFNVNTTVDTWVDGVMLIDLTECFGEGKEPTKFWCDKNIPYFEGDTAIEIRIKL